LPAFWVMNAPHDFGQPSFVRAAPPFHLPEPILRRGIRPDPWTPATIVLREVAAVPPVPGWAGFGDAVGELRLARSVAQLGIEEANRRNAPDPWDDLKVPDGLDVSIIGDDILANIAPKAPARPEILPQYRQFVHQTASLVPEQVIEGLGSNNWVIGGAMTTTGRPMVMNDPHREVMHPSLGREPVPPDGLRPSGRGREGGTSAEADAGPATIGAMRAA
jgi:penicillin amidase